MLTINPEQEKQKIVSFLQETFKKQKIENTVIGLSGGVDSATSFALLSEVLPPENIIVAHLYYFTPVFSDVEKLVQEKKIPQQNIHLLSIKESVDTVFSLLNGHSGKPKAHPESKDNDSGQARMTRDQVRIGNIAARMRMVVLFDLAKKVKGLVVGTENKSEYELSYFTRFGDQASDIEPIEHLYKTQVYQLAKHLEVPETIILQHPTAGLWQGQTDEGEFGFTYEEADKVLFQHLEQHVSVEELEKQGLTNARKILSWREKNLFKHNTPYVLEK